MTTSTDQGFSTQADAIRAAREFIWGDVPFARREAVTPRTRADLYTSDRFGRLVVSANVNGHLFVFHFDNYGREQSGFRVVVKAGA